jgi:hypothetical protein
VQSMADNDHKLSEGDREKIDAYRPYTQLCYLIKPKPFNKALSVNSHRLMPDVSGCSHPKQVQAGTHACGECKRALAPRASARG